MAKNTAPRAPGSEETYAMTPERIRDMEAHAETQGRTIVTVAVIHARSAQVVGFSDLQISEFRPHVAYQQWSAVTSGHRRRGLGRSLKARLTRTLIEDRPGVRIVCTDNAEDNASVRAINTELGFRPIRTGHRYHGLRDCGPSWPSAGFAGARAS